MGIVKLIFDSLKSWTQNFVVFLFMFAIMLYTLRCFFHDGDRPLNLRPAEEAALWGVDRFRLLFDKFISTTRAALKSTLILGGIRGAPVDCFSGRPESKLL